MKFSVPHIAYGSLKEIFVEADSLNCLDSVADFIKVVEKFSERNLMPLI